MKFEIRTKGPSGRLNPLYLLFWMENAFRQNDRKEHDRGIISNVNTSFEEKRSQEPLTARKDN